MANGVCEPNGFCAYPDSACVGGYRYDRNAGGGLSNMCVGGGGRDMSMLTDGGMHDGVSPGRDAVAGDTLSGDSTVPPFIAPCIATWCMVNPPPLRAVQIRSATDGWAVGDYGTILHYNGVNWTPSPSGTALNLYSVWATSASDAWAVGGDNTNGAVALHWNGKVWALNPGLGTLIFQAANAVWGSSPNDYWVGAGNQVCGLSSMAHFDGSSWSQPASLNNVVFGSIGSIYGTAQNDVWVVGGDGGSPANGETFHFDGTNWTLQATPANATGTLNGVWATSTSPAGAWAVGNFYSPLCGPGTLSTADNWSGTSWSAATNGLPSNSYLSLSAVWGNSLTDVWAVGAGAWHFSSGTWANQPLPAPTLSGVSGASPNQVWMVGEGGAMLLWNGTALTNTLPNTPGNLKSIWESGPNGDVIAVGSMEAQTGQVLHSVAGSPFTVETTPDNMQWQAVWGSGLFAWAVGNAGTTSAVEWRDTGPWYNQFLGAGSLNAIAGSSQSDIWAGGSKTVAGQNAVYLLHYNAGTWTDQSPSGVNGTITNIWVNSATDAWAYGNNPGSAILLHNTGSGWTQVTGLPTNTGGMPALFSTGPNNVWIALENSPDQLYQWNGSTWTPFAINGFFGGYAQTMWGSSAADIWVSSQWGYLAHFDGVAWTAASNATDGAVVNGIWGSGPTDVWAAGGNVLLHKSM
jgi:hypothetical protein